MSILKLLPRDDAADVYLQGEARGGDFALNDIPHPCRGLYLAAKLEKIFKSKKYVMKLDNDLFNKIQAQAEASPRKRMNYDLRTQADLARGLGEASGVDGDEPWRDMSQRMINVLMRETVIPIHRHSETSETVIVCRGAVREVFYDSKGNKTAEFVLEAGGECPGIQVPKGVYHTCVCLQDGSVIFEAKDRPYDPAGTEEFLGE